MIEAKTAMMAESVASCRFEYGSADAEALMAHQCLRYVDSELDYTQAELTLLLPQPCQSCNDRCSRLSQLQSQWAMQLQPCPRSRTTGTC